MKRLVKLPRCASTKFSVPAHTSSECAPPPQPARGCAHERVNSHYVPYARPGSPGTTLTGRASGRSHELRHPSIRAQQGRCVDRRRKRRYEAGGGTICLTASRATKHLHVLTHQPMTRDGGRSNNVSASAVLPCPRRASRPGTCAPSNVVWSRHIANKMPANRRARATVAMRRAPAFGELRSPTPGAPPHQPVVDPQRRPGGLHQQPAHARIARLGDVAPAVAVRGAVLTGDQAEITFDLMGAAEAPRLVEGCDKRRRDHRTHPRRCREPLHHRDWPPPRSPRAPYRSSASCAVSWAHRASNGCDRRLQLVRELRGHFTYRAKLVGIARPDAEPLTAHQGAQ